MDYLVELQLRCPHCGEVFLTTIDTSAGDYETVIDCEICCRPIELAVRCEPGEVVDVGVARA